MLKISQKDVVNYLNKVLMSMPDLSTTVTLFTLSKTFSIILRDSIVA